MFTQQTHPFKITKVILSFLQDLIDKHRAFFTIKVYFAALAACRRRSTSADCALH